MCRSYYSEWPQSLSFAVPLCSVPPDASLEFRCCPSSQFHLSAVPANSFHRCTAMATLNLAHTTVLSPLPADASSIPSLPSISLLPFSIAYDGPARVSTYFHPSAVPSTSSAPEHQRQQAAFRGRLLVSRRVALPAGYGGLVFSSSVPQAAAPVKSEEQQEQEERRAKKAKLDAGREREKAAATARGLRRSPRKAKPRKEVQKFSLDSDEEEDEEEAGSEATLIAEPSPAPVLAVDLGDLPTSLDDPSAASTRPRTPSPQADVEEAGSQATTVIAEAVEQEDEGGDLLQRDIRYLTPACTFNSIDVWHADHGGELEDDVYSRTMGEWVGLSAKVSPVVLEPALQGCACVLICRTPDSRVLSGVSGCVEWSTPSAESTVTAGGT